FAEVVRRYPVKRSAILPLLHLLQDQEGWLSTEALEYAASLLELTPAQVHDAATYYTMFRFKPEGKHQLEFCTNLSCALYGADELIAEGCRRLGVKEGEPSPDGNFTVHRVECLAACGGGPAVQVDGRWVENVTPADLDPILSGQLTRRPFTWPKSPGEAVILRNVWKENSASIDVYKAGGGYAKLKDFLSMKPEDIIDTVKKSNLRGRGGAGFPTGMKWGFLPKDSPKPRYLLVNADESEPGTCADRHIIANDPHELIESLEGKRGQPRLKPPFPATHGVYGCPTIVNNVETIACVPLILERGAEWFAAQGTEKNGGPKLYCVSGHVKRPGTYEASMGKITLRQLIYDAGYGGGMRDGRQLRAVVPGGSSTPVLTDTEIDVAMGFERL